MMYAVPTIVGRVLMMPSYYFVSIFAFSHTEQEEGGIALFLLGYHVVLAVKALRCSRRKAPLRSSTESASPSLDRCAATWISPAPGNSARPKTGDKP
jgi:hypothetical protein